MFLSKLLLQVLPVAQGVGGVSVAVSSWVGWVWTSGLTAVDKTYACYTVFGFYDGPAWLALLLATPSFSQAFFASASSCALYLSKHLGFSGVGGSSLLSTKLPLLTLHTAPCDRKIASYTFL